VFAECEIKGDHRRPRPRGSPWEPRRRHLRAPCVGESRRHDV